MLFSLMLPSRIRCAANSCHLTPCLCCISFWLHNDGTCHLFFCPSIYIYNSSMLMRSYMFTCVYILHYYMVKSFTLFLQIRDALFSEQYLRFLCFIWHISDKREFFNNSGSNYALKCHSWHLHFNHLMLKEWIFLTLCMLTVVIMLIILHAIPWFKV